ncbi:DUF1413 domain-containing protein [Pyxidicoccus fallax]|uniref:DUF1413 domain-containing protein n=1 Tax=Pyxidicoccus fallax TaxID=394095 RepID=A0A848LEI9_9BACT|nr:DUF1413 domain-containing protein [Pyxidicoccus fallax]NMO15245.1 DUF1413 domain-containing protein [Pyxidicoccus fallax]NPC76983.1 DUF1413 domain-containing protein [Pyxidicoccus fallax]
MLQLALTLDADLAMAALEQAREAELDLDAFVVEKLRQVLVGAAAAPIGRGNEEWLTKAVERARAVPVGQEFKLQDLFSKDEWKQIPSPTVFGREFRKEVEPDLAIHVRKTPQNQAIYERR